MQSKTRRKELSLSESQIQNQILQYLEFIPGCFAWRNNSTGVYDPSKGIFRKARSKYAINGVADIIGVFNGRFLAIEVKKPSNKLRREDQTRFLETINKNGGIAFYATSVEEVKKELANVAA